MAYQLQCKIDLNEKETERLCNILDCKDQDLPQSLEGYASSALEEYIRMILGDKVFTRGADFKEYRLYLLIKHVFKDDLPGEKEISDHFQVTPSQARTLLRNVISRYQYDLEEKVKSSLREVLQKAEWSDDDKAYLLTVDNENKIFQLNLMLVEAASEYGELPSITKKRDAISTYIVKRSSRAILAGELGLHLEEEIEE